MHSSLLKKALRCLPLPLGEGWGEGHASRWTVERRWPVWALAVLLLSGCDGPQYVEVSEPGGGAYEASLARLGDGWAVAWHDTRDGHPEIYARLLDVGGHSVGPPRRLTDTPDFSYEPQLAAAGVSELLVAWYAVSPSGGSVTHVAAWDLAGDAGPRWTRRLSDPARLGRNVIVRVEDRRLFCAWIEKGADDRDAAVWAQWLDLDLDGRPLAPPQRLADAGPTTWNLNAAIDDAGRAWVVFDATAGTRSDEIFLYLLTSKWVEAIYFGSQNGVEEEADEAQFLRKTNRASR